MVQNATLLAVQPFEDVSDAYFRQIEAVSKFDADLEQFHALRLLACRIAEHRMLMGIRSLREAYLEQLHAGLVQRKNLTELTVGNIALANGRWFYRPVQSTQPASLPFLSVGRPLQKEDLYEMVVQDRSSQMTEPAFAALPRTVDHYSVTPESVIPSEELRMQMQAQSKEYNLAKPIKSRLQALDEMFQESRQKLANMNLRLVLSIVRSELGNLNDLDAIQDGNLGLLKGISRYQPLSGYRLTTYCTWWIRKYVKQSRGNRSLVRIPFNKRETFAKVHKFLQSNPGLTGAGQDIGVIARELDLRETQVEAVLEGLHGSVYIEDYTQLDGLVASGTIQDDIPSDEENIQDLLEELWEVLTPQERVMVSDHLTLSREEKRSRLPSGLLRHLKSIRERLDQ